MSTASHVRQRTTVPSPGRFTASSATWLAVPHPGAQSRGRGHLGAEHLGQQGADRVAVGTRPRGRSHPGVGQSAQTGTIWYPAARMPGARARWACGAADQGNSPGVLPLA